MPQIATDEAVPIEVPNDDNEWKKVIDETRTIDRNFAIKSIKEGQDSKENP